MLNTLYSGIAWKQMMLAQIPDGFSFVSWNFTGNGDWGVRAKRVAKARPA